MSGLRVEVATPADLPAVFALRHEVFVVEQGVPVELEYDAWDADAVHVGAWRVTGPGAERGRLLGAGRLIGQPPDPARIGRMAVRAEARGGGVGAAVLRRLEREAARRGHTEILLHAQTRARRFYARCGYHEVGDEFSEANILHIEMRRILSAPIVADDGVESVG